ncbi:MAG TPA: zf-HC2 domain-containing protein, partial [Anaerolineales bacterium]|nr:zf-HC2 domain-containing protein [Anaerolineales bacterium]
MSVLGRLSPRDLELLSAYVDGELSPRQKQDLEVRLASEADLQRGLAELRSVKANLAALPEERVPRNFTLRPVDAPSR